MTRSSIIGNTDYSHQSFEDMISDLENWIASLRDVQLQYTKNIIKIKESRKWEQIDYDFVALIEYAQKFYNTSILEISEILGEIREEVRIDHIKRIDKMGRTAIELNRRYGRVWHSEYRVDSDENFGYMRALYIDGREMAGDMIDLTNLSARLNDYVGKRQSNNKVERVLDSLEAKPNFYGFGIDLKKLFKSIFNKR